MSVNEPRTNNPGLGKYAGRTTGVAVFLVVLLFFTAVHFYYATSALLDLLAIFILFTFLFFLGLSLACLALCARVGPGDLPSRFSSARMETFIRAELQRAVDKARGASKSAQAETVTSNSRAAPTHSNITTVAGAAGKAAALSLDADEKKKRWQDLDEEEAHQLANVASTAALSQRASPAAAEAEMERMAVEARLRMHETRVSSSTDSDVDGENRCTNNSDDDGDEEAAAQRRQRHPRPHEGDGVNREDGSIHNSADDEAEREVQELPAYMPEMMQLRRQRKIHRGLEIVLVSEAAKRVLQAIDSNDFDQKREEMGYLIPGANWCRFCNFYQMNDTRHCKVCCRCVYRSKVHCVCCGKCIGYANSKYYVLFLFYLLLAMLMANSLDLYCVNWGYSYFFTPTGEANSIYYLVFVYTHAIVVIVALLLIQYLLAAGRNVGLLTELLQQQREEMKNVKLRNSGEQYQMVLSERTAGTHDDGTSSPVQAREPFSWKRAMNTVGEGLPLPLWFWPVPTKPAVNEVDDTEGFWDNLREAIRIRLRSVADEDDVFTDEDEVFGVHGDECPADRHTQPNAAAAAAAAAVQPSQAVPAPAAQVPHCAKSTDVAVVPVAVVVAPAPTTAEPKTHTAMTPTGPWPPATPPIARAAPPAPKQMD